MRKRRLSGTAILLVVELVALIAICVLGALKLMKPEEEKRTIHRTDAVIALDVDTEVQPTDTEQTTEATTAEQTETTETAPPEPSEDIQAMIADMTLEDKVAMLFVVSPENLTGETSVTMAGNVTRTALGNYHLGGLTYSYDNYVDDEQMRNLLNGTQSISEQLMNHKPLMFGRDAESNQTLIYATTDDMSGLATALSTADGVANNMDDSTVRVVPCYPQISNISPAYDVVMLSTEGDEPTCLSEEAVTAFRQSNGYYGIIVTERLDSEAITDNYTSAEAAVAAVNAGVDMIYEPEVFTEAYDAVVTAVNEGEIEEDTVDAAVGRILTYMNEIDYLVGVE